MAQINQLELQNLRHLITDNMVSSAKCSTFADAAKHPQLKELFDKGARDAQSNVQRLKQFLQ